MSSTFDVVAKVISETSEIPLEQITPEAHAIDDLGIDSLDFLDIVFALDKKFGIKIPLEAMDRGGQRGPRLGRRLLRPEEPLRPHRRAGRGQERLTSHDAA